MSKEIVVKVRDGKIPVGLPGPGVWPGPGRAQAVEVVQTEARWQYDYGQVVRFEGIELPAAYEVQFSNGPRAEAVTVIGGENGAAVPNALMATGKNVNCWLVLHDGTGDGRVVAAAVIPIMKRGAVSDAEPTEEEQSAISAAISALQAQGLKAEGHAVGQQNGQDVGGTSPYYHDNAKYWAEQAEDSAEDAEGSADAAAGSAEGAAAEALKAEGYAVGTQDGEDVTSGSPYYENSAKHWAEEADLQRQYARNFSQLSSNWMNSAYNHSQYAKGYSESAAASATAAAGSATAAEGSKETAANAAAEAAQEALDASGSAAEATQQATAAEGSAEAAAGSADDAAADALVSEGWALGKQNGQDVGDTSPYYHDNADYMRLEAEAWAKGTKDGEAVPAEAQQYQDNAKYWAQKAAADGGAQAEEAEAWATGTKDGEPVDSGDDQYHNNAKYWAEKAGEDGEEQAQEAEAWAKGTKDGTDVSSGADQYHNNAKYYSGLAEADALKSEGYAVGKQNGADVSSGSDYYHNSAKYYQEQAAAQLDLVTAEGEAQIAAIEDKAEEVLDSIPEDYTALSEAVEDHAGILYREKECSTALTAADSMTGQINTSTGAIGGAEYLTYGYEIDKLYTHITATGGHVADQLRVGAFYSADTLAECGADTLLGEMLYYTQSTQIDTDVPAGAGMFCLSVYNSESAHTVTVTETLYPVTDILDAHSTELAGKVDVQQEASDAGKVLRIGADGEITAVQLVDSTLAVSGSAADAKAAGDLLRQHALALFSQSAKQLFYTILNAAVFTTDQSSNIAQLRDEMGIIYATFADSTLTVHNLPTVGTVSQSSTTLVLA